MSGQPDYQKHPNRRAAIRLQDMLQLNVPIWKMAEVLELPERTLYYHYGKIIKQAERSRGVIPHEPSPESRARVKLLASVGTEKTAIARMLDIGINVLTRHYRDELDLAAIEANAKVAANLYMIATGPRTEKTTVMAAIHWTKTRMGWKETVRSEQTGADGGPILNQFQHVVVLPDNNRGEVIDGNALGAIGVDGPDASWPPEDGASEDDPAEDQDGEVP